MSIDLSRAIPLLIPLFPTVVATAAGCAATLDDPARFLDIDGAAQIDAAPSSQGGGQCADVPSTIFLADCAISGCHSAKDMASGLDLESAGPYARLVGKTATGGPGLIIDPGGNPQLSVLYLKLRPSPPFGAQMPLVGAKLDDSSVACVASWISQGAGISDAAPPSSDDAGSAIPEAAPVDDTGTPDDGGGIADSSSNTEGGADAGGATTFTQVYSILSGRCLPCHATGAGKNTGKLDMSTKASAFNDLVGVAAASTGCVGKGTRVVAGHSATSLLIEKLRPSPVCGKQMPSGMLALGNAEIAQIAAWIDSGAPND